MQIKLTKPLGVMAIVTDADARKSEVIDVDAIAPHLFVVNFEAGVVNYILVFGGYDASGKFHRDITREGAQLSINRKDANQKDAFDALCGDECGNACVNFTENKFKSFLANIGLALANERVWGMESLEIEIDGAVVYKKEEKTK